MVFLWDEEHTKINAVIAHRVLSPASSPFFMNTPSAVSVIVGSKANAPCWTAHRAELL